MLETIREYAAEQLEHRGDAETMRQRHADYFLGVAEEAEPHLTGADQAPWLERLEAEHDNFRLSLDSLRRADRGGEELRLVGALMRFWYVRGHLREGSSRCEEALAAHDDQSKARLKALFGAALLAHRLGDYQRAEALLQERLALARVLDDPEAVASSLNGIGLSAHGLGDYERAAAAYTESAELARAGGYTWFLAIAIDNLGDLPGARRLRQGEGPPRGSPGLFRQLGDERMIGEHLVGLGTLASREGRTDEAETLLRQTLEYAQALVDKEIAIWCLSELRARALQRRRRAGGQAHGRDRDTARGNRTRPVADQQRLSEQTRNDLVSELGEERLADALCRSRDDIRAGHGLRPADLEAQPHPVPREVDRPGAREPRCLQGT